MACAFLVIVHFNYILKRAARIFLRLFLLCSMKEAHTGLKWLKVKQIIKKWLWTSSLNAPWGISWLLLQRPLINVSVSCVFKGICILFWIVWGFKWGAITLEFVIRYYMYNFSWRSFCQWTVHLWIWTFVGKASVVFSTVLLCLSWDVHLSKTLDVKITALSGLCTFWNACRHELKATFWFWDSLIFCSILFHKQNPILPNHKSDVVHLKSHLSEYRKLDILSCGTVVSGTRMQYKRTTNSQIAKYRQWDRQSCVVDP